MKVMYQIAAGRTNTMINLFYEVLSQTGTVFYNKEKREERKSMMATTES